jgi:hypothetical protein
MGNALRRSAAIALGFCLIIGVGQASAWEFGLSGDWNWKYEYYNEQGRSGFFGQFDRDVGGTVLGGQNLNFWYGIPRITSRNIASGSDAVAQYMYLCLYPEIAVNQALKLRGKYRVGGWNDSLGGNYVEKTNSYYLTGTAVGTEVAMAEGHWTQFWATAKTPWGSVVYGKRPKNFGLGLQYDGNKTVASESLLIRSDYGPFVFGIGLYPYRQSYPARTLSFEEFPILRLEVGSVINKMDKSFIPEKDFEGFVIYRSGPLEMGIFSAYSSYHQGGELLPAFLISFGDTTARFSTEGTLFQGTTHVKYNNGRFFFNAEAAWLYGTRRENINFTPEEGQLPQFTNAPTYVEQWRQMIEAGFMAGPAKLSFLYAFTPGLDRRQGRLIDRQPSPMLREPLLTRELASVSMWQPYAYILPYMYNSGLPNMVDLTGTNLFFGLGSNLFNAARIDSSNREGAMLDALCLAARLDYAVASNLNAFATFFKAHRASDGYGWGCIAPFPSLGFSGLGNYEGQVTVVPNFNNASPTIPDKDLGYEVDAGFDWKLLEGWNLGLLVGRWQPGKWFSYACVDRSVPNWWNIFNGDANDSTNNYGTKPGKTLDPIWATTVSLTVGF